MGIPSYFVHIVKSYPTIIKEFVTNKTIIDNFYIDSNSIIYDAIKAIRYKKEDKMYEGRNGMIHMESFRYIDAELAIHNQECKLQKQKEVDKSLIDLSAERKLKDIKENPDKYIG